MDEDAFGLPPDILKQVPLFAEIVKALSWQGGPVNWDLARQVATAVAGTEGEAPLGAPSAGVDFSESLRVAGMWISEATGLPEPPLLASVKVVTPAGWAEMATEAYPELIDPLAGRIGAALAEIGEPGAPEGAMIAQAMRQMTPLFLGMQAGAVLGSLARDVMSQHDLPFPGADDGSVVFVPAAIDAFAREYGLDPRETRVWVAMHEAAHRLEFEGLTWVRTHFFALYHAYIAALDFDVQGAMERLQQLDITNPEGLEEMLGDRGLVGLLGSPDVASSLERLQSLIAVLEAYADTAMDAASAGRLPGAIRIREAATRRRAEETRGERLFHAFIGIDLRAEDARTAQRFAREALAAGGWQLLNRLWEDPDTLPSPEELADAGRWIERMRSR